MKKIGFFIRNWYRITIVKTTGAGKTQRSIHDMDIHETNDFDLLMKRIVKDDPAAVEPDGELYELLESSLVSKNRQVKGNSIGELLLPFFSLRHIELKMAVFTLILVISVGINPSVQYSVNRNISPFSLADTLIDSSRLDYPIPEPAGEQH